MNEVPSLHGRSVSIPSAAEVAAATAASVTGQVSVRIGSRMGMPQGRRSIRAPCGRWHHVWSNVMAAEPANKAIPFRHGRLAMLRDGRHPHDLGTLRARPASARTMHRPRFRWPQPGWPTSERPLVRARLPKGFGCRRYGPTEAPACRPSRCRGRRPGIVDPCPARARANRVATKLCATSTRRGTS